MDVEIPDKSYFRIGEVSRILGVEPYVVRYWESEFKTIKPVRTKSDQRLYRKKDVEELVTIRNLLYSEQFTIAGAKKKLSRLNREDSNVSEDSYRDRLVRIKKELLKIREMVG
ncbi:MAG: MerR family transcriptional regulator [Syntrophales bacterium]|nr:MerR family transcriptional regulator [Syntrophales bacterium]